MAFGLGNLFSGQSNIRPDDMMAQKSLRGADPLQGQAAGRASLPRVQVGSVISGQVTDIRGDAVTITTDSGQSIMARMEDGVSLLKGSYLSFEVSGASDQQISLKALFTNTAAGSSTMSGALAQAGISENAASFGMVRSMMENGMPIDKNSLVAMYRQVVQHPQADSGSIVDMTKLGLPLTDENITQFQSYKNLEHHITETVNDVSEAMAQLLDELAAEPDPAKSLTFIRDFVKALSGENGSAEAAASEGGQVNPALAGEDAQKSPKLQTQGGLQAGSEGAATGEKAGGVNEFLRIVDEAVAADEKAAGEAENATDAQNPDAAAAAKETVDSADFLKALRAASGEGEGSTRPESAAGNADRSQDADPQGKIVFSENTQSPLKEAASALEGKGRDISALFENDDKGDRLSRIAKGIDELLNAQKTPENAARLAKAAALLKGDGIKDLMSGELSKQWKMNAADISSKEDVQAFYNKLRTQTKALSEVVKSTAGQDNAMFRQVENIRQNVDFMDQLNRAASYVQLPLHLSGEDAQGDLYVYTNKKSLADNNGRTSAFLHLDMDSLGPVDVYVVMEHEKISTDFYLPNDEMIDFISENVHILDERLADMGYDASFKVSMKEKSTPSNVMEEIVNDHRDGFMIGNKSFDVRA